MKIVDDSGSDVEDLIQTAEKTEGKTSVVKEQPTQVESKEEEKEKSDVDEPMPSVSKNESEHKSEEIIETKIKAPKTKTAEKELKSLPA